MKLEEVLTELAALGSERMKKIYLSNGAREPLFGVATGAMKPLKRTIKINQPLAEELYATGNYDAMYFAGVIADPNAMTKDDYNRWLDLAYFYMLSDYVVAVTLAEANIAEQVASEWIASEEELKQSAGWHCYCWMLGNRKDETFNHNQLEQMIELVMKEIHQSPRRVKIAMNYFIETVGVSYKPLHEEALQAAKLIGDVELIQDEKKKTINSVRAIEKNIEKGRIGFKRKHVRC